MHEKYDKDAHIRCRAIIEVLGKPKEYVEESIKKYVSHIKQDPELVVLNEEYSEIREQGNLWSKFVELEIVVKGMKKLVGFCFDYMPSSIELLKPDYLELQSVEISDIFNDLQARLHSVDMVVKQLKSENDFIKHNMNVIIRNAVVLSLKISRMNAGQLSKATGLDEPELQKFLDDLLNENKIKKENEIYHL